MRRHKVLYVPDRLARYRLPFISSLSGNPAFELTLAGDVILGPDGVAIFNPFQPEIVGLKFLRLKNIYVRGVMIWQSGLIKISLFYPYDTLVIWGEAHKFSTWLAGFIARIRGRRLVVWGHGMYGNEGYLKTFFRSRLHGLANLNFTYGYHGRELLCRAGVKTPIKVIYNSMLTSCEKNALNKFSLDKSYRSIKNTLRTVRLLYVGRLIPDKKLHLMAKLNPSEIQDGRVTLTILGDGPELNRLKKEFDGLWAGRVDFKPADYNFESVGKVISDHDILVSPGNIGLAAMHALYVGTPVITHSRAELQMPEFEAVKPGISGELFAYDSVNSLLEAVNRLIFYLGEGVVTPGSCVEAVSDYSVDNQVKIFTENILGG